MFGFRGVIRGRLGRGVRRSFSNPQLFYDQNRSFGYSVQDKRPYFMTMIHFFRQRELSNFFKLRSRNLIFLEKTLYLTRRPLTAKLQTVVSLPLQKDTLFKTLTSETADNFGNCETKVDSNKPNLVEVYSTQSGFRPHVELIADCLAFM